MSGGRPRLMLDARLKAKKIRAEFIGPTDDASSGDELFIGDRNCNAVSESITGQHSSDSASARSDSRSSPTTACSEKQSSEATEQIAKQVVADPKIDAVSKIANTFV